MIPDGMVVIANVVPLKNPFEGKVSKMPRDLICKRTESEIDDQIERADDVIEVEETLYPDLTYEEGVAAALRWIKGDEKNGPMDG